MALVNFVRKAVNIDELKEAAKRPGISQYSIIDTIELSHEEYNHFIENLLDEFDFISDYKDKMYSDANCVWHCILVKAKDEEDGILVESEGYDYARYSAYLSNSATYK